MWRWRVKQHLQNLHTGDEGEREQLEVTYNNMSMELETRTKEQDLMCGTPQFALGAVWNMESEAFSTEHFVQALASMRPGTASGSDGITAEGFMAAPLGFKKALFVSLSCRTKDPQRTQNTPKPCKMKY